MVIDAALVFWVECVLQSGTQLWEELNASPGPLCQRTTVAKLQNCVIGSPALALTGEGRFGSQFNPEWTRRDECHKDSGETVTKKPVHLTCIPVLAVLWLSGSPSDRQRDWALLLSQFMKSGVMCYSIRGLHVLCLCGWSRQAGTVDTNAKWSGRSASTYMQTHTRCML